MKETILWKTPPKNFSDYQYFQFCFDQTDVSLLHDQRCSQTLYQCSCKCWTDWTQTEVALEGNWSSNITDEFSCIYDLDCQQDCDDYCGYDTVDSSLVNPLFHSPTALALPRPDLAWPSF